MFEGCSNLTYINMFNFEENSDLNLTNIFLGTKDKFVYCLNEESNIESIISQLEDIECVSKDCIDDCLENKNAALKEKMNDINILSDEYAYKEIKEINKGSNTNTQTNTSIYSYKINNSDYAKNKYTNVTYIDFTDEDMDFI